MNGYATLWRTSYRLHHSATCDQKRVRASLSTVGAVAAHSGLRADRLDPEQCDVAVGCGWGYEHRSRVGLTGAGALHAGMERRGRSSPPWKAERNGAVRLKDCPGLRRTPNQHATTTPRHDWMAKRPQPPKAVPIQPQLKRFVEHALTVPAST